MRPHRAARIARCISVTFFVVLFEAGTASADGVAVTVDVHRDSCPSLSETDLARVEDQAKRIFSHAGVRMLWRARPHSDRLASPNRQRVHLVLVCGKTAERKIRADAVGPKVLGEAIHEAARAYIYADRVFDMAHKYGHDFAMVLARVAVHEVGHLVLPPHSHSFGGIMRANLDVHRIVPETFTPAARLAILRNLQRAAADAADGNSESETVAGCFDVDGTR
jgi:hypothetical protein